MKVLLEQTGAIGKTCGAVRGCVGGLGYGVVSRTTAHCTHEVGNRMVLGTTLVEVVVMVLTS